VRLVFSRAGSDQHEPPGHHSVTWDVGKQFMAEWRSLPMRVLAEKGKVNRRAGA
jgi:hypothetical protein